MCRPDRNTERRGLFLLLRSSLARVRRRRRAPMSFELSMALLLLAFLADDRFLDVLDALALVGRRWAVRPDLGRDLADRLFVGAADQDARRLLALDRNSLRNPIVNLVTETKLKVQFVASQCGATADP